MWDINLSETNRKDFLNKVESTFLYILNFKDFFKVGITRKRERLKHLSNVYKEFSLDYDRSYIMECDSVSIIKVWERFICSRYKNHLYSFDRNYEGMTECFNKHMLDDVLSLLVMLIKGHNRVSTDQIKLISGININDIFIKKKRAFKKGNTTPPYLHKVNKEVMLYSFKRYRYSYVDLIVEKDFIEFIFSVNEEFNEEEIYKDFPAIVCSYKNDCSHVNVVLYRKYNKLDNIFLIGVNNSFEPEVRGLIVNFFGRLLDSLGVENKVQILNDIERKNARLN